MFPPRVLRTPRLAQNWLLIMAIMLDWICTTRKTPSSQKNGDKVKSIYLFSVAKLYDLDGGPQNNAINPGNMTFSIDFGQGSQWKDRRS